MKSMIRAAASFATALVAAPAFAGDYHGPEPRNFDDAAYYDDEAPPQRAQTSAAATVHADEATTTDAHEGTPVRAAYDTVPAAAVPAPAAEAPATNTGPTVDDPEE